METTVNPLAQRTRHLVKHLFDHHEGCTYAVLDGASIEGLLDKLRQARPNYDCLYRGALDPDLAKCAPYLVQLERDDDFTAWLLAEGWGKHWGIFATTPGPLVSLRRHFRGFLMVKNPNGQQVYFRFYDPRVLRSYLGHCDREAAATVFGPIQSYFCEGGQPGELRQFKRGSERVDGQLWTLGS